jgi:putative ABC transport system permease protein
MLNDIRNTFRFLVRERLLAVAVLATLGIGIGINAAIFSVLDAVVIRPLPYPQADRLVAVWQQDRKDKSPFVASAANFLDWQKQTEVFEALAAVQQFQKREFNLAVGAAPDNMARDNVAPDNVAPDNVKGAHISPELFGVLRVSPAMGRSFTPEDADADKDRVVILSHDLWVSRFASDPHAVGRDLRLNGSNVRIAGVMPAGFTIPLVEAQIYLPLQWTMAERQERRVAHYLVLGRLKKGVSLETAGALLDSVAWSLGQQYPESNKDLGILINPLKDKVVGALRPVLLAIFSAAGCVLLLACLNLANLLGARGIKRQREMAIRAALGASRFRLLRQLMTEGLVIASLGGMIGLVGGTWAVRIFVGLFNNTIYFSLPRRAEIGLDWRVLAFTGLACLLTGILFSIAPAWQVTKANLLATANRTGGRRGGHWRAVLMVGEVGFSLALVIAAALLVRSYARLQAENPGFSADGVLTATVALPDTKYSSPSLRAAFFRRLVADTAAIPGASAVAAVRYLPMSGVASVWSVGLPGQPPGNLPAAFHHIVTPGYFEAMKIPVVEGRAFDEHDSADRSRVAILSGTAARRYFPNDPHPIGRHLRIEDEQRADWEVIGIVGDVRNLRPDLVPRPQIYVPMEQSPVGSMALVIRSGENPLALSRSFRDLVNRIDKDQAITDVKSLAMVVDDASARWRVSTSLFLGFGIAALVIAAIGLYSVVSYNVAQRTPEIAIRIALGGSYTRIMATVLQSVATLGGIGIALGLMLAFAASRSLGTLLYTIDPLDPLTFGAAAAGFLTLVLIIGVAAASKATHIQHALALKQE